MMDIAKFSHERQAMIGQKYCLRVNIFISILFISSNPACTFFESITVWRSPSGSYLYGCADTHGFRLKGEGAGSIAMKNYASQQALRDILAHLAAEHKREDCLALVEDSSAYNGPKQSLRKYLQTHAFFSWHGDQDFDSPLIGLTRVLEEKSLPVINTEFRFLRSAANTLRAWLQAKKKSCQPSGLEEKSKMEAQKKVLYKILSSSGNDIVKEYEEMATEVDHYTDRSLLDYYKAVLHNVRLHTAAPLEFLRQDHEDIIQYVDSHIPTQDQDFFYDSLSFFDSQLLDARFLHFMADNVTVKKIILFCGAAHVCQIGMVLENLLGYKKVAHVGIAKQYEHPTITFDPSLSFKIDVSDFSSLEEKDYELILAEDPERFAAGSYS